jgi:hypothetical protein
MLPNCQRGNVPTTVLTVPVTIHLKLLLSANRVKTTPTAAVGEGRRRPAPTRHNKIVSRKGWGLCCENNGLVGFTPSLLCALKRQLQLAD